MSELSRLRWLCRRGMKELDLVMSGYLERHYDEATASQQAQFRGLLQMQDPDLYNLLLGRDEPNDPELAGLLQVLRKLSGRK
ncbi:MAG: succinate dehydrogenase assembly factor 2 [Gammaproteobacteria bacterium]|nr:succinate dehydrogenase assembly factor 2 [Gammaproteobacteria bacterium]